MSEPSSDNWIRSLFPFVVMCFGGFMALLDIQIVASSLQHIGGGLSAAQDEISWLQTAYLIAEIIVIPLSGWLTRVFSTRWLFTASAAGFTATSMLCGIAWDIHSMILFRALQGALGASMIPIVFTSSLYYFQGPRRVYSAAVVGGIVFVARSLTFERPVVDLRALTNRNFTIGCLLSFVTGIGIFSTTYLTPLFLGYVRGFSAWQTGIAIFSTGAASLIGVPIYTLLARKFDIRWLMMLSLPSFGLSMWSYSFIHHAWV